MLRMRKIKAHIANYGSVRQRLFLYLLRHAVHLTMCGRGAINRMPLALILVFLSVEALQLFCGVGKLFVGLRGLLDSRGFILWLVLC